MLPLTEGVAVDHANPSNDETCEARFVQLLTSHQLDINLYVHSLMPDAEAAAEIIQGTNVVLWEKRAQFAIDTDFRAWAFQIARYELLEHLAQHKRRGLSFSDALIDELSLEAPRFAVSDDELMEGLRQCVAQLASKDRELLNKRYVLNATCQEIARSIGRPIRWVYKALGRIRQELRDCVVQRTNARSKR